MKDNYLMQAEVWLAETEKALLEEETDNEKLMEQEINEFIQKSNQEMEKELEISRYKLIKAEEKKSEVSKKIDELTREADSFEDGQEW